MGKPVSRREFEVGDAWTLKYITDFCDTEGPGGQYEL